MLLHHLEDPALGAGRPGFRFIAKAGRVAGAGGEAADQQEANPPGPSDTQPEPAPDQRPASAHGEEAEHHKKDD